MIYLLTKIYNNIFHDIGDVDTAGNINFTHVLVCFLGFTGPVIIYLVFICLSVSVSSSGFKPHTNISVIYMDFIERTNMVLILTYKEVTCLLIYILFTYKFTIKSWHIAITQFSYLRCSMALTTNYRRRWMDWWWWWKHHSKPQEKFIPCLLLAWAFCTTLKPPTRVLAGEIYDAWS